MTDIVSERIRATFQVVGVLAIVMVVAIHYRSAEPCSSDFRQNTANQLMQEFLVNGVCRVAVPLFALASGFFYFVSGDHCIASHLGKWRKRVSTLVAPYLAVSGIALSTWLAIRFLEGEPVRMPFHELLWAWAVNPPAEQLWFLRDLMVLVVLAPLIGWLVGRVPLLTLAMVTLSWTLNFNPAPLLGDWYALNIETMTFFSWGAWLAKHPTRLEQVLRMPRDRTIALAVIWLILVATRVMLQPDFDSWYVVQYTMSSLVVHQVAIFVGIVVMFVIASRLHDEFWGRLSGLSFFVYLVHEFPLRAVVERFADQTTLGENAFWVLTPIVTVLCFSVGEVMSRWLPRTFACFTGGRSPHRAAQLRHASNPLPVTPHAT